MEMNKKKIPSSFKSQISSEDEPFKFSLSHTLVRTDTARQSYYTVDENFLTSGT